MESYHLTAVPKRPQRKTGRIAVTTSARDNCPETCPLRAAGCYAKYSFLGKHWALVTSGVRGTDLKTHCAGLRKLAPGSMVRLHQAGDLPGNGRKIYLRKARQLLTAASDADRIVWTYTHYTADLETIDRLNRETGATVNASADSLIDAHRIAYSAKLLGLQVPIATMVDSWLKRHQVIDGMPLVICPAQAQPERGITCETCGNGSPLCHRKNRDFAVGFIPHGSGRKAAMAIAHGKVIVE